MTDLVSHSENPVFDKIFPYIDDKSCQNIFISIFDRIFLDSLKQVTVFRKYTLPLSNTWPHCRH